MQKDPQFEPQLHKLAYEPPSLVRYGKLAELTRHGHTGKNNDNINGHGNTYS